MDSETGVHAWTSTVRLADRFDLTIYDAAYLELVPRQGLSLATLDRRLREAAVARGIGYPGLG